MIIRCEVLDVTIGKWTFIKPMTKARDFFGSFVFENSIIVFGGYPSGKRCDVEEYDSIHDIWTVRTNLEMIECNSMFGSVLV